MELRAELAKLTGSEWQKASLIMRKITERIGKRGGPMGGAIQPRACKFCGYYGHTKQFCAVRIKKEEEDGAREVQKDAREREAMRKDAERFRRRQAERFSKGLKSQEQLWEELGVEWDWHPAGIGAFPKGYLEERARTIPKCIEAIQASDSCR